MNEEFQDVKYSLETLDDVKDISNNPVVKSLISLVSLIPGMGTFANSAIAEKVNMFQKEKREKLIDIIFSDGTITQEQVSDVQFIMEFAKLLDVIDRLSTNTKVEYLGKLFKNSMLSNDDDKFDRFEEYLYRFNELSNREIEILYLLYGCQKDWSKLSYPNENADAKKFRIWCDFKKLASEKFNISKGEVDTIVAGIVRTGFCKPYFVSLAKTSEIIYRATSDFSEFVNLVKEKQQ